MFIGKGKFDASFNIVLFPFIFGWWDAIEKFFQKMDCVLSPFQDDQDEVNQNYLADEEEEAEEEARVVLTPDLEEEEDEEEKEEQEEEKGEEEKKEEEGQGRPTGNAWWQKLQLMNEYLWDPERRMSLAQTGQSWSKSHSSQCPSLVSFAFGAVSRAPLPYTGWACLQTSLNISHKGISA
jgi:hypothetical protein